MSALSYHDGVRHEIVVRRTAAGDWTVLDLCAGEERVVDTLDGRLDGEPQAEAIARDYLTAGRFTSPEGRNGGEAIPEQGGPDVHSHRRPRFAPRH